MPGDPAAFHEAIAWQSPTYEWNEGLRGGATGVRVAMPEPSERALDEADGVDLQAWTVNRPSAPLRAGRSPA